MTILIPCQACAGTGWSTHEDRHARTDKDRCRPCKGTGMVKANTGEVRTAAYDPATGAPFDEPRERGDRS